MTQVKHQATVPALDADALGHHYGEHHVLRDVTFEVSSGEFVCIVGPSGVGKTTLLRCLSGLQCPSVGSVRFNGARVAGPPRELALVFQDYSRSLLPWASVIDNVALPLRAGGLRKREAAAAAADALHEVGLGGVDPSAYPWQLSGGMQQRVAIARALAYKPSIVLMDEPFASVDAQTRADLEDLVRRLQVDLGLTVLLVTHDIDEAVYLSDRIVALAGSPAGVADVVGVDLGSVRDQLETKLRPRFAELRAHVYRLIRGARAQPSTSN
ncbi:MAG: NitT/TauT family transport system ATP-binding protein [Micromonosporaceae bacterium]|jgi:NitT/TauT family transport system ATP-binding protein|nr:NitT/TauT family transport system ATP-binding protein [Micromonosporaceae bacterium]MDT5037270.1 NitT/TauT family transport system ATP-binding protein [Micromonosporaceae bacterium]